MRPVLIFIFASITVSCSPPTAPTNGSAAAAEGGEVLDVFVDARGTILVNGEPSTLDELKQELTRVKWTNGKVRYSRANPEGDPPPNAMEVIQAIVEQKLPLELVEGARSN